MCKYKNENIYMILYCHVKQCKKCDFYLGRGDLQEGMAIKGI
jgi:hypothetical protein